MKRHPALRSLSRDHHQALVVAQRLKQATDTTLDEARAAFLGYWEPEGRTHFREEEELLLPALARFADPDQPTITRMLIEHIRIRQLANELASDPPLVTLHILGTQLEQHIRHEERQLFPLIEREMPEAELLELAAQLTGSESPR